MLSTTQKNRLEELQTMLSNPTPDLYSSHGKLKSLNLEMNTLSRIESIYKELDDISEKLEKNKDLMKTEGDAEMLSMIEIDSEELEKKSSELKIEVESLEKPKDPKDFGDCIIEIRAGTGGDEAALFAADLFRMYSRYCTENGFKIEISDQTYATSNGFKEIIFEVKGENAFGRFKNESGVHRVQRIPATEASGRIHTSAASVVVLPIIEESELNIDEKDLKIDVYRASGPGGQGVNTTDSAVRITHIPTNIVVTCQDGRSQLKNKDKAMQILRAKLYEVELSKKSGEITDIRKSAIKTGDRSDKIKTYNYPQNRVTDHRVKKSWYSLATIMEGDIDEILKVDLEKIGNEEDED